MHNTIVIVNKKCCGRAKKRSLEYFLKQIKRRWETDVVFTQHPGHATKIAQNASSCDFIIAAGGDGTISEIVNGMNLETQALAVVPLGTGNSLARDLGITSPMQAVDIIEKNKFFKIDLISCQFKIKNQLFRKYVVATSGMGFVCKATIFANRYFKSMGAFCYPVSGVFQLFNQRIILAKIQANNFSVKEIKFTNFIVNNTKYAGNLRVFPKADLRDSAFNLLFTNTNALTQHLWNTSLITKTYFYYPGVQEPLHSLKIVLNEPTFFMLDGEILGPTNEITYSVMPQKLKLLS